MKKGRQPEEKSPLRQAGFSVLFGTWPYYPVRVYYSRKLDRTLQSNQPFLASQVHTRFRHYDQLLRYGQTLSLSQRDVIERLEDNPSLRNVIPCLMLGKYWPYANGAVRFNACKECSFALLYLGLVCLCAVFLLGISLDLVITPGPLMVKIATLLAVGTCLVIPTWLLAFYCLLPQIHFLKHRNIILQIDLEHGRNKTAGNQHTLK